MRQTHGLRTLNEGVNQRNLKFWPMWQAKYALAVHKNLGLGFDFRPCSEGHFLNGHPRGSGDPSMLFSVIYYHTGRQQ